VNLTLEALVNKLAMQMAVFSMAFLYLRNEIRALDFKELGFRSVSGGGVY